MSQCCCSSAVTSGPEEFYRTLDMQVFRSCRGDRCDSEEKAEDLLISALEAGRFTPIY